MRRFVFAVISSAGLAVVTAGPALATEPGDGADFGQHVAGMAPQHPQDHGSMFGECVQTMARTGDCPHHE